MRDDAVGIVDALDDTEGEFGHRDHAAGMKNGGTKRNRGEVDALRRGNMGRLRLCWMRTGHHRIPTASESDARVASYISRITNARIYQPFVSLVYF